jgi:glycosyltransferase involved in cell wall biosynthesis
MKKALILTGFNPLNCTGGIETVTKALIDLIESSHIKADVACASDFGNAYGFHNPFIGQVYAAGRSLLNLPADTYEFVVSNGYYGGGYFPKRTRTFAIFHSTHAGYAEAVKGLLPASSYLEIKYVVGELLEQVSASGAKLIAVSEQVRSELELYYGLADISVIANPVDTHFFRKLDNRDALRDAYGISRDKKVGLFVGRWEIPKGKDVMERLMSRQSEILWIIASASGGEPLPSDGRWLRTFSGLDQTRMRELYNLSDFMVSPSRYEGFGLAAAEAMACGLPVIGSPVGFLADVYSEGPFSALSLPWSDRDAEGVAEAIRHTVGQLLSDASLYGEVSEKGRAMISTHHGIARWKERFTEVLCLN